MIKIENKANCCGCSACSQVCPKECIKLETDNQGFLYPKVDKTICVNCHLCEKVCPVINQLEPKEEPLKCYLSNVKSEEERVASSSGGIFSALSKYVLAHGGVVFGVRFVNGWNVAYTEVTTIKELEFIRGSKYVQAAVNDSYLKVRDYLEKGRMVLFSGTPCYISGLNKFLRKDYEKLLTVDFVCHSIPSPKIWIAYLKTLCNGNKCISNISFRDKSKGWSQYSLAIEYKNNFGEMERQVESHFTNIFMRGFAQDIFTRPSCSKCPARNYTSGSDITLADAWDVNKYHPELNDETGISHVLVNSEKGKKIFESLIEVDYLVIDYMEVEPYSMHRPLTESCKPSPLRGFFYSLYYLGIDLKILLMTTLSVDRTLQKIFGVVGRLKKIISNK